jgi:hypothetical protein
MVIKWTAERDQKLLAAVLAAHPELKLVSGSYAPQYCYLSAGIVQFFLILTDSI